MNFSYRLFSPIFFALLLAHTYGAPQWQYNYPRTFRSIQNTPYLPPEKNEQAPPARAPIPYLPPLQTHQVQTPVGVGNYINYLPPTVEQTKEASHIPAGAELVNYIPPVNHEAISIQVGQPDGGSIASGPAIADVVFVQTDAKNLVPEEDCNNALERQKAGRGDIEIENEEPEGYDYPKPSKPFLLPAVEPLARTLDEEIPNEEPLVTTTVPTVESVPPETTQAQTSVDFDVRNRLSRGTPVKAVKPSHRLLTDPQNGPVNIRTLPFKIEQTEQRYKRQRAFQ